MRTPPRSFFGPRRTQDFGRKVKLAFSGCKDQPCALVNFHDIGGIAKVQGGKRGFEFYVGGGLGSVPYPAALSRISSRKKSSADVPGRGARVRAAR